MVSAETRLRTAEKLLTLFATKTPSSEPTLLNLTIKVADLLPAVTVLEQEHWGYLAAITGIDLGSEKGEIEVLYHFCSGPAILALHTYIARDCPEVPSVCGVFPSASFLERELIEMLGVVVSDTPNSEHLFLPDDWPAGVYPLRKDFSAGQEAHDEGTP